MLAFFLWQLDASTRFQPRQVATVVVEGLEVRLYNPVNERLTAFIQALAARPHLAFLGEEPVGAELRLYETQVRPGDADYGYALSQALEREAGLVVTFAR